MRPLYQCAAVVAGCLMVIACGSGEEASAPAVDSPGSTAALKSDCAATNVVAKVGQSKSLVENLPEDHPQYSELREAASNLIDTFNRMDSTETGQGLAGVTVVCEAYDEFAQIARSADLIE